jgi:hypothetical protein
MIEQADWSLLTEHFVPQAVLGKPPSYFEREKGITFTQAWDGLDYYKAALLVGSTPTPIVLKQYRGNDPNHTTIYLNPDITDLTKITAIIADVVSGLALSDSDVLWQRKDNPEA